MLALAAAATAALGPRAALAAEGDEDNLGSTPASDADHGPSPAGTAATPASNLATYYPPPVEGPALRLPVSPTRLYLDGAYAYTNDLSALPFIAGRAQNFRFALGGAWRWRDFSFEGEIPFLNVTILDVTQVPGGMPMPQDAHQVVPSFGDVRLGANWTTPLVGEETLVGGFGLRARLATHTTRFQFTLADYTLADYAFPYYFHIEPTLILGGALGRLVFVVNEGAVVLMGPDGNFQDQPITVPTIVFWDAHYAVSYAPIPLVGASVELATDIQINSVGGMDFQKFNGVHAVWVAPALQLHFGALRVDVIARLGGISTPFGNLLSRGQQLYGVLEFAGTNSYTVRATWAFN
jgi:hypothetical protein